MNYSWRDKFFSYLYYTFGFIILMGIIIGIFELNNTSLVLRGDALTQHLPMRSYMNNFFASIVNSMDIFNFNIAMGQDILFTHHYYGLTDIINFIISIVSNIINLKPYSSYVLEICLRGYLSGIAFLYLCIYFKNNKISSILGSLIYVFSNYFLCGGIMHPFFVNCMVFLPLIIVGVNKLICESRYIFFVVVTVLTLLSNIYLSYAVFVFAFFYGIFTVIEEYKKKGFLESAKSVYRGVILFILSSLISAFVLIPFIYSLLNSNRVNRYNNGLNYFISVNDMYRFVIDMFSYPTVKNFVSLSISMVVFVCLISFLLSNKKYKIKLMLILLIIAAFSPVLQNILNGLIYPGYRWYYALSLILSYIFVIEYERIMNMKKWTKMFVCVLFLGYLCIYAKEKIYFRKVFSSGILNGLTNENFFIPILFVLIGFIFLCLIFTNDFKYKKTIFVATVFLSLVFNVVIYSVESVNGDMFEKRNKLNEILNNRVLHTVSNETKGSFIRVENEDPIYVNASCIYNYPSVNGYYSTENKNLSRFNLIYKNSAASPLTNIKGLGSRSILDDIFSVKYLISKKDYIIPYGFEKTPESNLYVNKNYIPFGFTYSSYILPYEAATLSSLELQEMLMKSCLVDNNVEGVKHLDSVYLSEIKLKQKAVKFVSDPLNKTNNKEKKYTCITSYDGELYMKLPNEDFEKGEIIEVYLNGKYKRVDITTKKSKWYSGEKEALICLGYVPKGETRIIVKVLENGNLNFNNVSFECLSTDGLEQDAKELSKEHLYNISISKDGFKGYISNKGNKLLFISIPYDDGWSAYVDSEKTRIYRANEGFMAIKLGSGDHFVEFRYERPYQELSYVISIISSIITVIYLIKLKKKSGIYAKGTKEKNIDEDNLYGENNLQEERNIDDRKNIDE